MQSHQLCTSRRHFLGGSLSCGTFLMLGLGAAPRSLQRAFASEPLGESVVTKPFARVEKLLDGVWGVVSTPFDSQDFTTLSNGGIIQGKDAVLAIEGTNTFDGGKWMSDLTFELTGRRPDYVVLTHHHPDHSNGLSGYLVAGSNASIISAAGSRKLMAERSAAPEAPADEKTKLHKTDGHLLLPDSLVADDGLPVDLDLGGKVVRLTPRKGHTPSDLTVELLDPRIVWTGDLCFNGLFPYFGDAIPTELAKTCGQLLTDPSAKYVPGHGSIAVAEELKSYLALLEDVAKAALDARNKGIPPDEAWKSYKVPESLGDWRLFKPEMYLYAFEAWDRELKTK